MSGGHKKEHGGHGNGHDDHNPNEMYDSHKNLSYDDFHEEVHGKVKTIHKYMAKLRDTHSEAIKAANEAIDYEFERMDEDTVREKYKNALVDKLGDITKKLGVETKDKAMHDHLVKYLGGVTEKEIERILRAKGSEYLPEHIERELENAASQFSRAHYSSLGNEYALSITGRKHATKYLGLEGKVQQELITAEHLSGLFAAHGPTGEVHTSQIPHEIKIARKRRGAQREGKSGEHSPAAH